MAHLDFKTKQGLEMVNKVRGLKIIVENGWSGSRRSKGEQREAVELRRRRRKKNVIGTSGTKGLPQTRHFKRVLPCKIFNF